MLVRNLLNLICLVYYGSKIGFIQNEIEDGKDDPILIWKILSTLAPLVKRMIIFQVCI